MFLFFPQHRPKHWRARAITVPGIRIQSHSCKGLQATEVARARAYLGWEEAGRHAPNGGMATVSLLNLYCVPLVINDWCLSDD